MSPGRFASELVLDRDGTFHFSYEGEIFSLGLIKLAQLGADDKEFEASTCYDEEYSERECTDQDIAENRAE